MKIIFLDIDGVLNSQIAYENGFCKYNDDYGQDFYPESAKLLNKLIDETKAKIVISSTWRCNGLETMQNMWKDRNMSGEVISITPSLGFTYKKIIVDDKIVDLHLNRGIEINTWLSAYGFEITSWDKQIQKNYVNNSGIENFIIIDDDYDMLYQQKNHFIHVDPYEGFNEKNYSKSQEILSKSVIDLYDFN